MEWENAVVTNPHEKLPDGAVVQSNAVSSVDQPGEQHTIRRPAYAYAPRKEWRDTENIDTSNVIQGKRRKS